MKETLREKLRGFSIEKPGWMKHVLEYMFSDICPKCGCDILVIGQLGETIFVQCPDCEWRGFRKNSSKSTRSHEA